MCGIAGLLHLSASDPAGLRVAARRMADRLTHRGPDDGGDWAESGAGSNTGVALAHRRLSIIDLSQQGAQPMQSESGRYVISYNGEIYNFQALQLELQAAGARFRGRSDTEVMLAAFDQWGVNQALQKLNGMFAFALWDKQARQLHLVRDRLGKKPLYVGWAGKSLLFASELKAFHAHPDFPAEISHDVTALYMRYGFVPAPHCIYRQVWQVPPGGRLRLDLGRLEAGMDIAPLFEPYWHLPRVIEEARSKPVRKADDQIVGDFEDLLRRCVQDRMISDVPLGAFLSGGVDSSMVVALMQQMSDRPVSTYTIGFKDAAYDEAAHAAAVARHLGTDHHSLYIEPQAALDLVPQLAAIYDEPFADASQIPTVLLSRFAREQVSVALSGDGGDEMLGGYVRHFLLPGLWRSVGWMPHPARRMIGRTLLATPQTRWDALAPGHPQFGRRVHKFADLMDLRDSADLYRRQLSRWADPGALVPGSNEPPLAALEACIRMRGLSTAEQMMAADAAFYLPHDVLTKTDRASMAASLEVRAPLLDARIFDYVWRLPQRLRTGQGSGMTGKWLLRQALARHVPSALFERPKQGFTVPLAGWLRGELRPWAESLLDPAAIGNEGVLDPAMVQAAWQAHLDGDDRHTERLWTVLMFRNWHAQTKG